MRITGPNIYMRYLSDDDVDGLTTAIQGFWKNGRTVSTREVFSFKYGAMKANQEMFYDRQMQDGDVNEAVFAICTSDDQLVGYNISLLLDRRFESAMTAFLPEYRSQGCYTETVYLRHRLAFDVLGAEHSLMKIPLNGESPVKSALDAMYSETEAEFSFQGDTWRRGIFTADHYAAYLEANPEVANIEWSFSW